MRTEIILAVVLALMALEGLVLVFAPELLQRVLQETSPSVLRLTGLAELALATVLAIVAVMWAGA